MRHRDITICKLKGCTGLASQHTFQIAERDRWEEEEVLSWRHYFCLSLSCIMMI